MAKRRPVPLLPNNDVGGFYTPEAEARRWGLLALGLRHRSRRRHKAFVFLGCWLLFSAMIVAMLLVTL